MSIFDDIDIASEQYAKALDSVRLKLVDDLIALQKQGLSKTEIVTMLSQIDMEAYVLEQLGFSADIDNLLSEYQAILANIEGAGVAQITDEVLQAMVDIDRASFVSNTKALAGTIRQELSKAVTSGLTEAELANTLSAAMRADHAATLANTSLNTFSRQVTSLVADEMPDDTKFIYIGPVDDRTRDICLEMASAGSLTREEVNQSFPGSFIDGGGFNCRHKWEIDTAKKRKQIHFKKDASKIIDTKKQSGKWKKPQTLLEKAGDNV